MPVKDYYATLGLTRTATENEIRQAYKKLALLWHPDKNPHQRELAEENFKNVNEAYEVLSDPNRRAAYDRGESFTRGGSRQGSDPFGDFMFHDPFSIFEEFFGGNPFGNLNSRSNRDRRRTNDVFDDSFMMAGFGGFGGFGGLHTMMSQMAGGFGGSGMTSVTMSSSSNGFGGGMSRSVRQETVIRDGRKVQRTVTTTRHPDGTVHEDVDESIEELPNRRTGNLLDSSARGSSRSLRDDPDLGRLLGNSKSSSFTRRV